LCLAGSLATVGAKVYQEQTIVKGVVVDETGESMPAVNVRLKGTGIGAVTDLDGTFSLAVTELNSGAVLVFSFLGYASLELPLSNYNQQTLRITLREDMTRLDEVVVTALGIMKKEKSLTYSTQIVNGEELIRAKDPNMMNSLSGKTAGVQINRSSSGLGGSVKVNIRGNRSIRSDNQPLYVIDGIPIYSSSKNYTVTTIGGDNDAPNRDGGDGISNLNPDDIESMNILKGPAAAALYGSSAANGVIVITTKKGKSGRMDISFNTNTTLEQAAYGIPEFQDSFTGVSTSWGRPISSSPDYASGFFKTGVTSINSLSVSSGSDAMQTYFSYANTFGKGTIDGNRLNKHNFNFRETANFFAKKLTVDANINLMYQTMLNRTTPGGYYLNPLVGLYHFPRGGVEGGESFDYYKENYQYYDVSRNMYLQNWYPGGISTMEQNPYWLINKLPSEDIRSRAIMNLGLTYVFTDYLSLQLRGNADYLHDKYNMKMYAGTHAGLASSNGRYLFDESDNLVVYGDALLTFRKQSGDITLNATLGGSIKDNRDNMYGLDTYPAPLYNPNVFTIANMNLNAGRIEENRNHAQERSLFFAGQAGFRDYLFLDVTARNDWTSSMLYTNSEKSGFFYPSIGLTWIVNQALALPQWINLGKLRGAWSKVGSSLPNYISNPLNRVGLGGNILFNATRPFSELKPEMTESVEVGTEWRFFGSQLEFDFTYYKTNTRNQLFSMSAPSGSKYSTYYINAGNIQNRGIEIVLSGSPVWTNDFRWKTGLNYSFNKNKVLKLADDLHRVTISGAASNSYSMRLEVGGSFGDIYGYTFLRDEQNNILYDEQGIPFQDKSEHKKVGNTNPDFNLGWQNTFTYKALSLYFLVDGRVGGDVISLTQADLDKYGVSKASGDDRLNGGVSFHGKKIENVLAFYSIVGGRDGITEHYVYDATNVRLREFSIGYSLPKGWFAHTLIKHIDLSVVGRNLFFFYNKAPYDPDGTLSSGNTLQGVDVFGMPSNRSLGVNLKVNF
jgi:TonB-linked SusC/RagA family outer membrane protein